ncbi:MAG TPA: mycothiol synthase [Frankiaceae bacterium]|jgi:mycothiol synthase|nr:mycothiol synthase [Frankiaceae bacterium]
MAVPDDLTLEVRTRLEPEQVSEIRALVAAAAESDGVHPLSEHVALHLAHGGDPDARNVLARVDGTLVGYAHLDLTDVVAGASSELVVHPDRRRQGIGAALVGQVLGLSSDGRLRLWAHGNHPAAAELAKRLGFRRARALFQMRRSLYAALPKPELPDGVTVRTFVPGQDEERWVEVNNAAFAEHPEQGQWTVEDLRVREKEPWFDPEGFFLAERDGELLAFHWTKVHGSGGHHHEAMGEVYVVGVSPSAQRLGLGPAMTLVGLRHLRSRGLSQAMLYVDEANTNAIRVYERLGFARWDTDVSYVKS